MLSHPEFFLDCVGRGNNLNENYREIRIITKTTALFHRIPKEVITKLNSEKQSSVDKRECMDLLRIADIAKARCYNIKVLLSYEVTSTAFFLTKDGFLRAASNKSLETDTIC